MGAALCLEQVPLLLDMEAGTPPTSDGPREASDNVGENSRGQEHTTAAPGTQCHLDEGLHCERINSREREEHCGGNSPKEGNRSRLLSSVHLKTQEGRGQAGLHLD